MTAHEIISNADKSALSTSMPNVLRLAESAGDRHLAGWCCLELLGYTASNPAMTETIAVPEYRTVAGQWFDRYNRRVVFEDPKIGFINEVRIQSGIAELESFIGAAGVIAMQMPANSEIIRQHLGVEVTTFRFSSAVIPRILAAIKRQMRERLATRETVLAKKAPECFLPTENGDILRIRARPGWGSSGMDLKALWRRLRA